MGIKIAKKEQKLGIRASSTCSIDFDDLKIPAENIIGGEGKGYKVWIIHFCISFALSLASPCFRLPLKSSTRVKFSLLYHQILRRRVNARFPGRIGIAAQMLGLAQGAFDKSVPYTYERQQFGQAVGTFQGMSFQFAQAAIDIESARLLTYNASRLKEEGQPFAKEAAMAKYWASTVAQRVSGSAIEWAGGIGFTRETGIEKFWRDSKIVGVPFFFFSVR
jgi:short/branched chain acyl-CoA dehydrogenase